MNKGYPVTLTWSSSNALRCNINGIDVPASGSKTYYPTSTTTYTLQALSEAGGQSKSITVIVSSVSVPTTPTTPPVTPPSTTVICVPGALKCIGPDLYVCNTAGTAWTLKQANSPTCQAAAATPNFWVDPIGWVIAVITQAWEAMLGFVSGGFNLFLNNIKNFINNFSIQLAALIRDPLKTLRGWLDGVYIAVSSLVSQINSAIGSWWTSTSKTVVDWINNAVNAVKTWFNDQIGILQRGWDNVVAGLSTWLNDQIAILQRGWNNVVSGIQKWFTDQIAILQRGWDLTFGRIPDLISSAIQTLRGWIDGIIAAIRIVIDTADKAILKWFEDQIGILQRGWDNTFALIPKIIETYIVGVKSWVFDIVPGIVEGVIIGLIESIPGLKKVIDFIGSLYDTLTGKHPTDPQIQENKEKTQKLRNQLQDMVNRW